MASSLPFTRDDAEARDRSDPLAPFRERFVIPDETLVYLDGNSLGRLPRATLERLGDVVESEWGGRLIRGWWERWLELPVRVGDLVGELVGAAAGQVIVADSTSVCLFKLAAAALDVGRGRTEIVVARDEFPTDRYLLEGLAASRGLELRWLDADPVDGPSPESVAALLGPRTALVVLSHVNYRSASIAPLEEITARRPRCRSARALGPLSQRRRTPGGTRRGRGRPRRWVHLQVPQRGPGRAGLPLRPP